MPSACVRSWWKSSRSTGALIGAVRPSRVAFPSAELTMFTAMYGRSSGARSLKPRPLAASSTVTNAWSGYSRRSSTAARLPRQQRGFRPPGHVDARREHVDQEDREPDQPRDSEYPGVLAGREDEDRLEEPKRGADCGDDSDPLRQHARDSDHEKRREQVHAQEKLA